MLNPISYTENVVSDFLRYQITTYPFADAHLYAQMRRLLNIDETRATPLLKGPYISLSRSFRTGAKVADLIAEGILHPHLITIAPHSSVYGHQESAIRAISAGKTTLISTGTGSGKTESFLYPIISRCLHLRDQGAPAGIVAIIVYPMNALAEDQLGRLRDLLAGTGISFGMYVGKTPERAADVAGKRLQAGSSREDYRREVKRAERQKQSYAVHPPEERPSREEMRTPGKQPRILLTNVNQLELLLTRQKDVELFDNAQLEFLVFDEAHTFTGANGAETACLIRRLRAFCGRDASETVCVATSATIVDPERGPEAGRDFAMRFFGVPRENVVLVGEEYEPDLWAEIRHMPPPLPGNPVNHLKNVLTAVEADEDAGTQVCEIFAAISGERLDPTNWQEDLYERLAANELLYQMVTALESPRLLQDLVGDLTKRVGRFVSEEEILLWLALGAAARKGGRTLLRPVVHTFVRGVSGAVVTFPEGESRPRLWLSAEEAGGDAGPVRLPVMTCTTCGQHYFVHHVADFNFTASYPTGGQAVQNRVVWPALDAARGGKRVVLLDQLVIAEDQEEGGEESEQETRSAPRNTVPLQFCRYCGALHPEQHDRCDGCGRPAPLVTLYAVQQKEQAEGHLTACVACQSPGRWRPGGYREPARPVRATTVSDVHVLAQNMIHRAERRRLLVFTDNRQDAAFQAGWMEDHARRYRLRALMYEEIQRGPISVGDLTAFLDDRLDADDTLSRALVPEVWRVHRKEAEGVRHKDERKRFLRIQVLREVTTGLKQRIGLEPWGRIRIQYQGLTANLPFITRWASLLDLPPEDLVNGVASLLDVARRNSIVLDREGEIFSRFWQAGDFEIQRGYLPLMPGIPKALKLTRSVDDDKNRIQQWVSTSGVTLAHQVAQSWGVPKPELGKFFSELWLLLADELEILAPVTLKGARGRALPGCTDARQIDADKLRIEPHAGVYRCRVCRRAYPRPTPRMACMAWRCQGTLQREEESKDNYDLMVLDQQFTMIRPREHSAQVPAAERELLERIFKSDSEVVNTLVCTPTLELGVDIGALDAVLMRNVPPLPANYWQRTGRAGRRHRMAVNVTYARPASHDRAYFRNPLKLLQGTIMPPRFNLRNELMVEKHVHAALLTVLHQLARPKSGLAAEDRREIKETLDHCFPAQVKGYLFDEQGHVRGAPLDVSRLTTIISKHQDAIMADVRTIFAQGWPPEDAAIVSKEALQSYVQGTGDRLAEVITRLWRRLQWALDQMERLDQVRRQRGVLDPDEEALRARCERLVKKLKGIQRRSRREAEGYDDTNTYSVLAVEGFLPGYGLSVGSILGTAQMPRHALGANEIDLPRAPAMALREYAPGNLIYANGNRFVPRFFHLEPVPPVLFQVDIANEAVVEVGTPQTGTGTGLGAAALRAVPICDVDLPHQSHITDEEDYRFQLPVSVYGYEQDRHSGGKAFTWGRRPILLRQGVHLRLVNVGAASLVARGELGYPVCLVCGQSRSPLASQADRDSFVKDHRERCGQLVEPTGFFADVVADTLTLQDCSDREEAYSLMEAIRIGAATVLDMEVDDLQVLVIGRAGSDTVDALLYDPMPGGSGLLEQMVARWPEIVEAALNVTDGCASRCEVACVDCLLTFRNAYFHRHLNRHRAAKQLRAWGAELIFSHDVPARMPRMQATDRSKPTNEPEQVLLEMLRRAGFPEPEIQHTIELGRPLGSTTPDFYYEDPTGRFEGICIYLDGMSRHLHGNERTRTQDREIREELRAEGYEVIEIPYGHLHDSDAMARTFYHLGRLLLDRARAAAIRENQTWHVTSK